MPLDPWDVLQKSLVFSAQPWLNVYRDAVKLPGGRILDDFYQVVLPEFAVAVPVSDAGELVMVRGYKHGLGRVSLGAPAGYIEPGEAPLEAAKRELLEETGYSASEWHTLGRFMVDGNRQCGMAHLFLARHAARVSAPNLGDANEEVEVELVSFEEFFQAVRSADVALLPTVCAVSLAMLFDQYLDANGSDVETSGNATAGSHRTD